MIRSTTLHKSVSVDREELQIITVYEPGVNKQQVKKENKYSKRHGYLILD